MTGPVVNDAEVLVTTSGKVAVVEHLGLFPLEDGTPVDFDVWAQQEEA